MNNSMMGAGIAIGVAIGTALGLAMDNFGAGLAIGIGIGVALGTALSSEKDKSDENGARPGSDGPGPGERRRRPGKDAGEENQDPVDGREGV